MKANKQDKDRYDSLTSLANDLESKIDNRKRKIEKEYLRGFDKVQIESEIEELEELNKQLLSLIVSFSSTFEIE